MYNYKYLAIINDVEEYLYLLSNHYRFFSICCKKNFPVGGTDPEQLSLVP